MKILSLSKEVPLYRHRFKCFVESISGEDVLEENSVTQFCHDRFFFRWNPFIYKWELVVRRIEPSDQSEFFLNHGVKKHSASCAVNRIDYKKVKDPYLNITKFKFEKDRFFGIPEKLGYIKEYEIQVRPEYFTVNYITGNKKQNNLSSKIEYLKKNF